MPETPETRERSPLSHPGFRAQLTAVLVSQLGSGVAPLAIAFGVLAHNSVGVLSTLLVAGATGILCTALYGGVLADRMARNTLAGSMDLVKALCQTMSGLLLMQGAISVYWLVPCQFVYGLATGLGGPAQNSLSRDLLRLGQIRSGASYLATTKNVSRVAGPLLGGLLVARWGGGPALLFDAATFLVSASLLFSIRLPVREARADGPPGAIGQAREALRIVAQEKWIAITFVFFFVFSVAYATTFILGPLLNVHVPHGASRWSWVMGAIGAGAVCGGLLSFRDSRLSPVRGVVLTAVLVFPLMVAVSSSWPLVLLLVFGLLAGIGVSMANVHWAASLQTRLDNKILGRVNSLELVMTLAAQPLGYAGASILVLLFGATHGLAVAALVVLVAGAVAFLADLAAKHRQPGSGQLPGAETIS